MAHSYIHFPPNGPNDEAGRPLGKCACGRWEDSAAPLTTCPNATQYGKDFERERQEFERIIMEHRREIERRFEEQKEKELNLIFHREYNLQHVNHSLADFLPNGIRKFLQDHAMACGLRGRVSRDFHDHVHIVLEGKKHELAKMKAVIDDLKRRTVVGEIVPFRLDQAIEDYNYDSFEIGPNLHNKCVENAPSDGDQWEKKSSSRGSDRFVFDGGYDSQKKYC